MRGRPRFPQLLFQAVVAFCLAPLLALAGFATVTLLTLAVVLTVPMLLAAVPFVTLLWQGDEGEAARPLASAEGAVGA